MNVEQENEIRLAMDYAEREIRAAIEAEMAEFNKKAEADIKYKVQKRFTSNEWLLWLSLNKPFPEFNRGKDK